MGKTIKEINRKIEDKKAKVVTADEMTSIVAEKGPEAAAETVDVVTTGTFGAMCSSGVWLNFGHSDPPIKMTKVWLNDVEAYTGVAAVDAYVGATQMSETLGMEYGGAHVIEDILKGKPVVMRAVAYGTDCYPRKEIVTEITIQDLNQAVMSNPRNGYQSYNAATNSSNRTLHTYMGKLLPNFGNVNFSGAGQLSPLMNDPEYATIGIGTRIFLAGGVGYIVGSGTQHNPAARFATLMVQGDLRGMSPDFLKAAVFPGYGCTLYVGIGIPIPVLNAEIALKAGIADADIQTNIIDYSVASRNRPTVGKATYAELKSGKVTVNGRSVAAAPLASFRKAGEIADLLKRWMISGRFFLSEPVERLSAHSASRPMVQNEPQEGEKLFYRRKAAVKVQETAFPVFWDAAACIHCGACLGICPVNVFTRDERWEVKADPCRCTGCGQCEEVCPVSAIALQR